MEQIVAKTFASQFFTGVSNNILDRQVVAIKNGRLDILHSTSNPEQLHSKDERNKNLLFYAVYYKQPEILLYLIRKGVQFQNPTTKQARNNSIVQQKQSKLIKDHEQKTLMHLCCFGGSIQCFKVVRFIIKLNKVIKLANQYNQLLQHYKFRRTDFKDGRLKYEASSNRNQKFNQLQQQATLLYKEYVRSYSEDTIDDFKAVDKKARNSFHYVCLNKYQKCPNLLEQMFQELSNSELCFNSPLQQMYAQVNQVMYQQVDPRLYEDVTVIIKEIISPKVLQEIIATNHSMVQHQINGMFKAKDINQNTPLQIAYLVQSTTIINFLKLHLPPNSKHNQIEVKYHSLQSKEVKQRSLQSKPQGKLQHSIVSNKKKVEHIISLIEQKNNSRILFGKFSFIEAIKQFQKSKDIGPIKSLIKNGLDVNQQDINGWTVMHHASSMGLSQVVELLINQSSVNISKKTNKHYHILHMAAMSGSTQIIDILKTHKKTRDEFNLEVVELNGCTPLHYAAKSGNLNVVKRIIELQGQLYCLDKFKMNALHHAAQANHVDCIKYFVGLDSDKDIMISQRDSKNKFAKDLCEFELRSAFDSIFTAVRKNDLKLLKKIIFQNPSAKDSTTPIKKHTPLIVSIIEGRSQIAKYLIDSQADQYHEDAEGRTASFYTEFLLNKAIKQRNKQQLLTYKQIKSLLS